MAASILISGAGPAGLSAALTAVAAGAKATVYERADSVGRRFHGDFQGIENWTTPTDALEEFSGMGIQMKFDYAPFRTGVFWDARGREYPFESNEPLFYLVRRGPEEGTLDDALKRQVLDAGADIRFGEACSHLPDGGIVAEGPRSVDAIAVGYVFDTDMADGVFGVLSDRLAPKAYAYLLVHGGRGTVATCMFADFHNEKVYLERTIDFFREHAGLRMTDAKPFSGYGNFRLPRTARKGNILYVGEAAGFQDHLWGFGLRYAMISGHLAARCMLEGRPETYDALWKRRLGGFMRSAIVNSFFYQRLGDRGYAAMLKRAQRFADAREWLRSYYAPSLLKSLLQPVAGVAVRSSRRRAACEKEGCDCTWCRCRHG